MDHPQPLPGPVKRNPLGMILTGIVGVLLWIGLGGAVYLWMPAQYRILQGFDVQLGVFPLFVLSYSWLGLPLIGIAAGICGAFVRGSFARVFLLVLLPILLFAVLAIAVGPLAFKLMDDLS